MKKYLTAIPILSSVITRIGVFCKKIPKLRIYAKGGKIAGTGIFAVAALVF